VQDSRYPCRRCRRVKFQFPIGHPITDFGGGRLTITGEDRRRDNDLAVVAPNAFKQNVARPWDGPRFGISCHILFSVPNRRRGSSTGQQGDASNLLCVARRREGADEIDAIGNKKIPRRGLSINGQKVQRLGFD
jgi:hypothetical protein